MSFVSYAQNFEDVMLWRALKHINNGFYIDIGAQDPVIDSVSLAFYEHGWRGVHIEPTQQYSTKLREARPDEIIEQVAVASLDGFITFYEFNDTGLSTADPGIAKRHQNAGFLAVVTEVPVASLDSILSRYCDKPVHWLKLDVEGLEKNVVESWQENTCRPWILVIESLVPLTQVESHLGWESLVLDKGYTCAYFDGLNKFYVHHDHHELLASFSAPPNIFDGFVLSGSSSQPFYALVAAQAEQAEAKAEQAEAQAEQAEAKAEQAEAKAEQAEAKAEQAEAALIAIKISSSWRLMAPLRMVINAVKNLLFLPKPEMVYNSRSWSLTLPLRKISLLAKQGIKITTSASMIAGAPRYIVQAILRNAMLCMNRHPKIKAFTMKKLSKLPWLKAHLKACMQKNSVVPTPFFPAKLIRDVSQISSKNVLLDVGQMNFSQSSTIEEDIRINLKRAVSKWPLGKRINE